MVSAPWFGSKLKSASILSTTASSAKLRGTTMWCTASAVSKKYLAPGLTVLRPGALLKELFVRAKPG
jgi:hypothetical protein